MRRHIFGLLLTSFASVGCIASTDTTEVGVRTVHFSVFGGRGVQSEVYPRGGTYFFLRPFSSWNTFDVSLQNLKMLRLATDDTDGEDELRFKTIDGNDIAVDVTVSWRIDESKAPYVVQFVGQDTWEVEDKLVRPVTRTVIRDVLNQLTSEEYYQADRRFQVAKEAEDRLNVVLNNEGVVIDQVLLGEHSFNEAYEQMIRDKKVAEQEALTVVAETEAGVEEKKREMETARGEVNTTLARADGEAQKRRLAGDASLYEKTQSASAVRAEKRANADALVERARALSGGGGRNMVKLRVAEALAGKRILFVPASGGTDLRTTDMNQLLQTYGLKAAAGK